MVSSPTDINFRKTIKPVGADSISAFFSSGAYRMLPYRQNIKNPTNLVGVGASTTLFKQNDTFINGAKNIILLLNQEYYGLLIHRKRSPFPRKGRLLVTLR